ncbi:MAG: hypothetical protein RL616_2167 [Verrucomicrobiota bacterium]
MKTLHKYLIGQVLATAALTVAVFVFVLMLMNVLTDVLPMLMKGQLPLVLVLKSLGLLLPFACVYALPMGFITATLLVFGRFSADHELTAARAGGVSLLALISPVLLLSLACCALSAWFNMDLGPRSRVMFKSLKVEMVANFATSQIPAGQPVRDFPGYILYAEKNTGEELRNVILYQMQGETNVLGMIQAESAQMKLNSAAQEIQIDFTEARLISFDPSRQGYLFARHLPFVFSTTNLNSKLGGKPSIGNMTFLQLRQELREVQRLNFSGSASAAEITGGLKQFSLRAGTNATPADMAALMKKARQAQAQQVGEIRVIMNRQLAFSFACFGFTLIGIPLGIRVHRRETNVGIGIALVLVVIFYAFEMLGDSLAWHPELYPHLIVWIPVFLFQGVGAVLLWRANRGT